MRKAQVLILSRSPVVRAHSPPAVPTCAPLVTWYLEAECVQSHRTVAHLGGAGEWGQMCRHALDDMKCVPRTVLHEGQDSTAPIMG